MLLGPRLVTLCCPPDVLELVRWPLAMESEYEGKLCDGHSRKWAGINWQPNCFPISWKPFSESKHQSSAKCYLKAFWRQHFVPAWLCSGVLHFSTFHWFSIITFCKHHAAPWPEVRIFVKNSPFFTNHQYDKLLFAFSIFVLKKICFTKRQGENTH